MFRVNYIATALNYSTNVTNFNEKLETDNINTFIQVVTNHTHVYNNFHNNYRTTSNWKSQFGVVLDFDSTTTKEKFKKYFKEVTYIMYDSRSNPFSKNDKFHIYFPLLEINKDFSLAKRLQTGIVMLAQHYGLNPDISVKDLARYFFPSRRVGEYPHKDFSYYYNKTDKDILSKLPEIDAIIEKLETDVKTKKFVASSTTSGEIREEVEKCVNFLKEYNSKNKLSYQDWLFIGQALTNIENGETYFIAISNVTEPHKTESHLKFFRNLQTTTHSISIATLFYVAKNLGYIFVKRELTKVEKTLEIISNNLSKQYKNVLLKGFYIKDGIIYHHIIIFHRGQSEIFISKVDVKYIKLYTKSNKELYNSLYVYLMENNNLMGQIKLSLVCGTFKGANYSSILGLDLPTVLDVDKTTGIIKLQVPVTEATDVDNQKANNWVMDILKEIFITEEEDYLPTILKFMAQFTFEHRTENKMAIFLMGARGTGKGVFVDGILGQIFNIPKTKYTNGSQFTHWKEALKIIDVNEADTSGRYDLAKLYADIKDYSGSPFTFVRKLHMDPFKTDATAYFIISQNSEYMYIADKKATENQFLVCNFPEDKVKTKSPKWISLDYTPEKMKKNLRAFIELTLLPIYTEMYPKRKHYRYGLFVPKTKAFMKYAQANNVESKQEFDEFLELFINIYKSDMFRNTLISRMGVLEVDLAILDTQKVLTNSLIKGIIIFSNFKKLRLKNVKDGFKNISKSKPINTHYILEEGKRIQKRGIKIEDFLIEIDKGREDVRL